MRKRLKAIAVFWQQGELLFGKVAGAELSSKGHRRTADGKPLTNKWRPSSAKQLISYRARQEERRIDKQGATGSLLSKVVYCFFFCTIRVAGWRLDVAHCSVIESRPLFRCTNNPPVKQNRKESVSCGSCFPPFAYFIWAEAFLWFDSRFFGVSVWPELELRRCGRQ